MEKREPSMEELFEFNEQSPNDKHTPEREIVFSNLEERLKLCQQCQRRAFSRENGLICSLTNKKPDFTLQCEHFQVDENLRLKSMEITPVVSTGFWVSRKPAIILSALAFLKAFIKAYSNKVDYMALIFLIIGIVWLLVAGSKNEERR